MSNKSFNLITVILCSIILMFFLIASNENNKKIKELNTEINEYNDFIKQYVDKIYYIKDEITLDYETELIISSLDSLCYKFFEEHNIADYNLYALDINYYQEQLRYEHIIHKIENLTINE